MRASGVPRLRRACLPDWVIGGPEGAAARFSVRRTTLLYKMRRLKIALHIRHQGSPTLFLVFRSEFRARFSNLHTGAFLMRN
jgi:hypothetical protein